jgi:hypothetical protein
MLQVEHLRHYSDALLRLSRETKEPQISAKLHEMADEFRIMVCVADVTGLAADLARDCARDGRQEADKDRIGGLPKRQRKRSGRARRTAAKAAPSPHPSNGTTAARGNERSAGAAEPGRETEMAPPLSRVYPTSPLKVIEVG